MAVLIPVQSLATEPFAKVGTYSLQFLKMGVSARATGMGGAFTAIANDATATYWNPIIRSLPLVPVVCTRWLPLRP